LAKKSTARSFCSYIPNGLRNGSAGSGSDRPDPGKLVPISARIPSIRSGIALALVARVRMRSFIAVLFGTVILTSAAVASAQTVPPQQRLCDPTFEDCRADVLSYIQQETVEIDM